MIIIHIVIIVIILIIITVVIMMIAMMITSSSLGSSFSSCSFSFSKRRLLRLLDRFQLLKLSAKCIVKNILSTSSS